jgi:hypothetical protein
MTIGTISIVSPNVGRAGAVPTVAAGLNIVDPVRSVAEGFLHLLWRCLLQIRRARRRCAWPIHVHLTADAGLPTSTRRWNRWKQLLLVIVQNRQRVVSNLDFLIPLARRV